MPNQLAHETSPYLLQHAQNPVHWQPWGEAALARARIENKPILLSIGYSACHWCHVMAHESFENVGVAATMNSLFVNIKVDREERPDLDQIYQAAQQMLTGRTGGWPLTMFLAPDGTPFYGGTYFPREARYGLPGFAELCQRVAQAWSERRDDAILTQNASLRESLARMTPLPSIQTEAINAMPVDAARKLLELSYDSDHGGFGGAPKFPHPVDLALLLRCYATEGNSEARDMVLHTLRHMAAGGIYDQLGGGFCRYSVDERWEIPHFEKMLYDNGPLLGLYADAFGITRDPFFSRIAEETAAWVLGEMQSPEGGFFSALDADSEGEEGKFYVWDREAVRAALSDEEWALTAPLWGLAGPPNFEHHAWHLRVADPLDEAAARSQAILAAARQKLLAVRAGRIRPGCDDKVLTSWNALMIEGLAHAGRLLQRPDWIAAARRALEFIRGTLWQAEEGRLLATWREGRAHLNAYLDDYAYLLSALLELLQADFRVDELDFAVTVADALLNRFEDADGGGFFFTAHDHETLIARLKPGHDGATPSGNGVAAFALQRLGLLVGEPRYSDAARRSLMLFWPTMKRQPGGYSSLLMALSEATAAPTTVILRGPAEALPRWLESLRTLFLPTTLVIAIPHGTANLPAALAKPESNHVNAWVCRGVTCLAPIGDFAELMREIQNVSKYTNIV